MSDALEIALDAIPATIFLYRPDQILFANRAAAALIGCSQTEIVGLRFEDVFERSSEAGSSTYLKTNSGKIAVTLTNEEIAFDGLPTRLITALKRDMIDDQGLFASVFDNTLIGIAVVNADGYYVEANATYGEIYGHEASDLIGRHLTTIFPLKNDPEASNRHARFIRGETPVGRRIDWTGVREDGQPIQISAFNNLYIAPDGERFRVSIIFDITPHNRTREALEKNQERLSSILNSMGDAVWSISADTYQLIYANPALEALTGYSIEDFKADPELLINIVHPDDRAEFVAQLQQILIENWIDLDQRIIRRDGVVRWIHKRFWMVRNGDGNVISGLMTDMTDRKLAVEQALQLKLENERVAILSNFVRDASHEFRTPLSVINMRLELMERTSDPEQHAKYIQRIKGQTDRILRLVEALILMSRLDKTTSLSLERVDVNRILAEMRDMMQVTALRNQLTFTATLSAEALTVQGDINELVHAFNAVFDNATAFTLPGGSVSLRTYRLNDREIAVEIRDTGIGIDPAHLPRIFERFYRADQAHSTQGFGLGLPITRKIVELHHGRIEVESPPGKGSLFRLVFPEAPPNERDTRTSML